MSTKKSSLMSASGRMAIFITVIATPSFLGGCQMGRTYVLGMAPASPTYTHVLVREADSMMKLTDEQKTHFEKQLATQLARAPHPLPVGAGEGQPLIIEYRLILHDAGSTATRVGAAVVNLTGIPTGSLGNGTLGVEVTFKDDSGTTLATILTDGPIDGPLGSTENGLSTVAKSVGTYARVHFAKDTPPTLATTAGVGS